MKIAMMSAWNEDSGVSVHAELIGRAWVEMGHVLKVFSFFPFDFHGTAIVDKDEAYVTRCFTTPSSERLYFDPRPILEADYEVFVAQDLGMLPKDGLGKIFHHIQRKASTLTVIHDGVPSDNPSFYQFDWDRIVCFDTRYEDFLKRYHPEEKISIIPFPCVPLHIGDKTAARAKLGLPNRKKIVLIFGQRLREYLPLLPCIKEVAAHLPCLLLVISQKDTELMSGGDGLQVEIRQESPCLERLYDYLHASDVLIIHRSPCDGVVVSSTAYQCLGSGCPILASKSNFFETVKDVVMTYSGAQDFKAGLWEILTKGARYRKTQIAAEEFLKGNSAEVIAQYYIDLFEALREERTREMARGSTQSLAHLDSIDQRLVGTPLEAQVKSNAALAEQILEPSPTKEVKAWRQSMG